MLCKGWLVLSSTHQNLVKGPHRVGEGGADVESTNVGQAQKRREELGGDLGNDAENTHNMVKDLHTSSSCCRSICLCLCLGGSHPTSLCNVGSLLDDCLSKLSKAVLEVSLILGAPA